MKVKFYHWYNAVLSALLTMLGFGAAAFPPRQAAVAAVAGAAAAPVAAVAAAAASQYFP